MKKFTFLIFLIYNFTFTIDNCSSQWVYQSLPSYYDVADIKFFDANTGLIVLGLSTQGMLKTTNGGNNWSMINSTSYFYQLDKIDDSSVYTIGYTGGQYWLYKTINKASTWDSILLPYTYRGISFVNKDTGWISGANGLLQDAIFRTTNGGVTLNQMTNSTGWGSLFFLKQNVNGEYIGWHYSYIADDKLWKTTNSGVNWFQATRPPAQFLGQFEFYDENTGWFTWNASGLWGGIYKTTNGGSNWEAQILPSGNGIHSTFYSFKIINTDTLYGCGGYQTYGLNDYGLIWKTTNGGINWGYQFPDSSFHNGPYNVIEFININTGWAYQGHGVHTTNGGGQINSIQKISENEPNGYELKQNYPNPFNPSTNIEFQISGSATVYLQVFDILGRNVADIINSKEYSPGAYRVNFNMTEKSLSSGIYFYKLTVYPKDGNNIFTSTKKMIYNK